MHSHQLSATSGFSIKLCREWFWCCKWLSVRLCILQEGLYFDWLHMSASLRPMGAVLSWDDSPGDSCGTICSCLGTVCGDCGHCDFNNPLEEHVWQLHNRANFITLSPYMYMCLYIGWTLGLISFYIRCVRVCVCVLIVNCHNMQVWICSVCGHECTEYVCSLACVVQ